MRRVVSKATVAGTFFVAGYLLLTSIAVFYSLTCTGVFCGLTIVLPVMPWLFLLEPILSDSVWLYFVIVLVNSFIFYFLGRYIGHLIETREYRQELKEI